LKDVVITVTNIKQKSPKVITESYPSVLMSVDSEFQARSPLYFGNNNTNFKELLVH